MNDGGWIPLDKRLAHYLPKKRPFTILEAMFSYSKDADEGKEKAIIEYSRIWSWSRCKVRRFVSDLKTGARHLPDRDETGTRQEIRLINSSLPQQKDRGKTGARQGQDRGKTATIDPDPNPDTKSKTFAPPSVEEVTAYCQERNKNVDPQKWHNHYSAKGWMIGKNKMKDWRAAVRTWEKDDAPLLSASEQLDQYVSPAQSEAIRKARARMESL